MKIPKGWRVESFEGMGGKRFTRAVDQDGCRWYPVDGKWILNVPYFRSSRPGLAQDDLAVVETEFGNLAYKITPGGTIHIGKRRIGPRKWNH